MDPTELTFGWPQLREVNSLTFGRIKYDVCSARGSVSLTGALQGPLFFPSLCVTSAFINEDLTTSSGFFPWFLPGAIKWDGVKPSHLRSPRAKKALCLESAFKAPFGNQSQTPFI